MYSFIYAMILNSHPDYLLRSQWEDGTWHVATRALGFQPYFEVSKRLSHGHDQWISQTGTALAAIALDEILDGAYR